jgi:glycosyltransferase involved in cell wall biosynthesis
MTTGVAVLVSDGGELPLLVKDPESVFPQNDYQRLATKIDQLAGDRTLLQRKAADAYGRSRIFDISVLAKRLTAFWNGLIAER